jgi:hypothetical protein
LSARTATHQKVVTPVLDDCVLGVDEVPLGADTSGELNTDKALVDGQVRRIAAGGANAFVRLERVFEARAFR